MWSYLIAFIAGAFLPFAFAPINIYTLAFFMPAILLYLWLKATPKKAFWLGECFGLGLFGVGSSWVYVSIHNFGNTSVFLGGLITFLLVLVLALYPAIQGYLLRKLWPKKNLTVICLIAFPSSWVLFEYLRSILFDGFPFLMLGYAQLNNLLAGIAPVFGVYGLSFVTALMAGALTLLTRPIPTREKFITLFSLLFCVGLGYSGYKHNWTTPSGNPIQLSLIQGNISQDIKWDPKELTYILQKYQALTEQHWHSQIIVWPEAAVPFVPSELPQFFEALSQEAKRHHSTIVFGSPLIDYKKDAYYNGLTLLGSNTGTYRKRHLVPFGEFIPLPSLMRPLMQGFQIPMSDLLPGPKDQPTLSINGIPTGLFICYETAFPSDVLRAMPGKAFAINMVDDAWFGHSFAAAQQLQMTQMRALETGRYIAVTANTGITAVINPWGEITEALPINQTGVLTTTLIPMQGNTPLMRLGYYPLAGMLSLLIFVAFII